MLNSLEWHDNDGPGSGEIRCAGCGCWNHAGDTRCDRCGRRLDAAPSAAGRRNAEEADALPGPSAEAPRQPPPEPEWKMELDRRLAGYRERKKLEPLAGDTREQDLPPRKGPLPEIREPRRDSSSRDRLDREPTDRGSIGEERLPAARAAAADAADRPISLPPLRRGAEAAPRIAVLEPTVQPHRPEVRPPIVDDRRDDRAVPRGFVGTRRPMEELLAPLSLRAVAGLMDVTVVLVALGVFLGVAHLVANFLGVATPTPDAFLMGGAFAILLTFYWLFYFRFFGRTAGMTWIGLRLLNFDAEPPDVAQRRNRVLGALLSGAALGVGFAWAAADEQGLCWHDRMSRTFLALDDPPE